VQLALIEQLIQLKLRISVMDRKWLKTGKQTDCDSRTYLAWVGCYARTLERIGVKAPSLTLQQPIGSLADHITARRQPAGAIEAAE
jgi:hypothetical protein